MAKASSRKTAHKTARKPVRKAAGKTKRASAAQPRSRKPAPAKSTGAPQSGKWVYAFGGGKAAGRAGMRDLLGGKGAGLAEMANLGLPVPPGFTITTEVCTHYYAHGNA